MMVTINFDLDEPLDRKAFLKFLEALGEIKR